MTKQQPQRRGRTGRLVCRCGTGYASEFDGLCAPCRSPKGQWITAWEAQWKREQRGRGRR